VQQHYVGEVGKSVSFVLRIISLYSMLNIVEMVNIFRFCSKMTIGLLFLTHPVQMPNGTFFSETHCTCVNLLASLVVIMIHVAGCPVVHEFSVRYFASADSRHHGSVVAAAML